MPEMTAVTDPKQIVAALHAEIASWSPEHAALVAAFEAKPPVMPESGPVQTQQAARLGRLREYAALWDEGRGLSREEAARQLGISPHTAQDYETAIRRGALAEAAAS